MLQITEAERTDTALPLALVSGIILTVVGVAFSETFLIWMGTPEDVLPLSTIYMRIYFCGMTFNMVYNFCAAILRAAGDTKGPLIYLTVAGIVNVVLNVFFVTVCHMNVAGVALATAISQGVSAVLVVSALMRRSDSCRLQLKKVRFYKAQLTKMISKGLPAGLQSSMFSMSNVVIQSSINSFGDVFMSGNAAASNIEGFAYVTMNAFHQTALNFTGQNVGAGNYKRVSRIAGICLGSVAVVGFTVGGLMYLFAPQLLSIYITDSPQAIVYGVDRMAYLVIPYFLLGLQDVTTGVLRGMGTSLAPMLISVLGICGLRIAWVSTVFQLEQFHTPGWLFVSYPISWAVTFAAQLVLYLIVYRKYVRKCQEQEGIRYGTE